MRGAITVFTCLAVALASCDDAERPLKRVDVPSSTPKSAEVPPRTWPADAPPPNGGCKRHDECAVIHWDGPFPPDPCCDQRMAFVPVTRAYLAWMAGYRAQHCAGVTCPAAPLPGAEPACCAVMARCVAGRCVQGCDNPTLKAPDASAAGVNCDALMPPPP